MAPKIFIAVAFSTIALTACQTTTSGVASTNPSGATAEQLIRSNFALRGYQTEAGIVTEIEYQDNGRWFNKALDTGEPACHFKVQSSFDALMNSRSAQDVYSYYESLGTPRKLGDDDTTDFIIKLHEGIEPESNTFEVVAPYCLLLRLELGDGLKAPI